VQIVTHSIHHAARGVLSTRAAPAAAVGGRRESMCRPAPAPRATRHSGPAWFPVQQRHYAQVTPADSAIAAAPASRDKHCGFEPEQVQQVLWRCKGIGFRVIAAPRSAQADMFKDVVAMCFSNQEADGSRAGGPSLAPWPRPYDPDMEYGASHAGAVMLFVNGHHEIHSRNVPLNYLILAEKAWAITVAGTNPAVSGQEKISCARSAFQLTAWCSSAW